MNDYHEDANKITFDRADILVERYIRSCAEFKSRIRAKDVAKEFEVKRSQHNIIRINEALDDELEAVEDSGSRVTQYRLP